MDCASRSLVPVPRTLLHLGKMGRKEQGTSEPDIRILFTPKVTQTRLPPMIGGQWAICTAAHGPSTVLRHASSTGPVPRGNPLLAPLCTAHSVRAREAGGRGCGA